MPFSLENDCNGYILQVNRLMRFNIKYKKTINHIIECFRNGYGLGFIQTINSYKVILQSRRRA